MKSAIAAAYDANAAAFAQSADRPVYRLLARPLVDVVEAADARAAPARPMLDVAAGTGALGRWCRDVVSVDLSAGQLAHNPNARRVLADAERLPFRDDAFRIACCAFGINHFPDPAAAVREMARVAPVVAVLTWRRPAPDYAPKRVLDALLRHHLGHHRSPLGTTVDELGDALGTVEAMGDLLTEAGLTGHAREVVVDIPWVGVDAYLDYRLAMASTVTTSDYAQIRSEAAARISRLPQERLRWSAALVRGVGRASFGFFA